MNNHKTRLSDSSVYDEVCINCGATDGRNDDRLNQPCPKPTTPPADVEAVLATEVDGQAGLLAKQVYGDGKEFMLNSRFNDCPCDEYWHNPQDHNAGCPESLSREALDPETDAAFDEFLRTDPDAQAVLREKASELNSTRSLDASGYVRGLSDALNAALETMANSETTEAIRALISQHQEGTK